MAEAFSKENADNFRYTLGLGWLVWDGKRHEIVRHSRPHR